MVPCCGHRYTQPRGATPNRHTQRHGCVQVKNTQPHPQKLSQTAALALTCMHGRTHARTHTHTQTIQKVSRSAQGSAGSSSEGYTQSCPIGPKVETGIRPEPASQETTAFSSRDRRLPEKRHQPQGDQGKEVRSLCAFLLPFSAQRKVRSD